MSPAQAAWLEEWTSAWRRAAGTMLDLVSESHYRFAGKTVSLQVAGASLGQQVHRTFAHLQRGAADRHALQIALWDEAATGIGCPSPSLQAKAITTPIGSGVATILADGRVIGYRRTGSATWLDRGAGWMVGWRANAAALTADERSKPIPLLLRIWYYDQNIDIVHAGLVAKDGRGVLIGGPAGAGKSTTALACVASGFAYLGDDEVGLERQDNGYVGHSVYGSARLVPDDSRRGLSERSASADKRLLFLGELVPAQLQAMARIAAVVLPRITSLPSSRLCRITAAEALLRLGATSLFTALGLGERVFERLQHLVVAVPCFSLELSRDAISTVRCIERALLEASA